MTGEITLRGIVLPIGGLKEKLLAAIRYGIKTVIIPKDNEKDLIEIQKDIQNKLTIKKVLIPDDNKKDLLEIPDVIKKNIEIIPVKNVDEVLKLALTKPFKRVEWVELEKVNNENKPGATSRH